MTATNPAVKGVNLDELHQEAKKLVALLDDRQPGLMSWNQFMQERMQKLHALTILGLGQEGVTQTVAKPGIIHIDRKKPFNPAEFIGNGWNFWRGPTDGNGLKGEIEQDSRSVALAEVDLSKVRFETCLLGPDRCTDGETSITGEERIKRLIAAKRVRLDLGIFQMLWNNQHLIPESWKEKTNGNTTLIFFDGQTLRFSRGGRCSLYLYWYDGKWYWSVGWHGRARDASRPSAVLES